MVRRAHCIIHILVVRGEASTAGLHLAGKLGIDADRGDRSVVMCAPVANKLCRLLYRLVLGLEPDQGVVILLLELLLLLLLLLRGRRALRHLPL